MFVEKIEISTSDYNRGSSNMNDILRIYGYLLKNHPESASQILYGVTLIQQYLGKSVDDLKDDMKKAVDDETYNDNIYEYYKTVIDTNNDYKKLLSDMATINSKQKIKSDSSPIPIKENTDKKVKEWLSIDSNLTSKKVNGLKIGNKEYEVKNLTEAYIKVFEYFYEADKNRFMQMMAEPFISRFTPARLTRYSVSAKSQIIGDSGIYAWTNLNSKDKQGTIVDVLKFYNYSLAFVKVSIDVDFIATERVVSKKQIKTTSKNEKIGKHVKNKMKMLSESGYTFTNDMLHALTSKELTKSVVGNNFALLVTDEEYNSGKVDKSKYWNDIMKFNGKMYHVTSQWFEYQRDGFDKWYKSLK